MRPKILNVIGEKFTAEAKEILNVVADVDYVTPTEEKLTEIISRYDAILLGLEVKIDKKVLDNAPQLKYIATATTGLDHIDTVYAESKGIEVLSLKGENAFLNTITGTAELACGLMISLLRLIPYAVEDVKKGNWSRESFRGKSLYGKTLGIVGLGRLGKMMARYGKAFGMNVLFADPHVPAGNFPEYEKVDFERLISSSDIVSIHVHLDSATENMFNTLVFKKMKKTSYLINTSRGKIVNEQDLLAALEENGIAGYATDVLSGELSFRSHIPNNELLLEYARDHRNVLIVPHIGGMTEESRSATDIFIAQKLKKHLSKIT